MVVHDFTVRCEVCDLVHLSGLRSYNKELEGVYSRMNDSKCGDREVYERNGNFIFYSEIQSEFVGSQQCSQEVSSY